MTPSHDVVLVGGGGAGLRAAIAIAETNPRLNVAVVSKVYPMRSHTVSAEGGAAGAIAADDSLDEHAYDTISGGDWLCDQDAVEAFVKEAPQELLRLEHWGCPWSRQPDGHIAVRPFGGMKKMRTWFAADKTGFHMLHTLFQTSLKYTSVVRYDEWFVTKLLVDDGRVQGVVALELMSGRVEAITARAVILCTGGCGRVFPFTTNASIKTGDGMALAYRAGAPLKDMEFVQYHPTGLPFTGILITEAARAEGGYLLNKDGYRYLQDYQLGTPQPKPVLRSMELGPRDRLSQAFMKELEKGRTIETPYGPVVNLDLRHLGHKVIDAKIPFVRELCQKYQNLDPVKDLIPVRPVVHYMMGGVHTDINGATPLAGLYAAGEVACVSINGANRLGSNSLPELLVFGARAGQAAAEHASREAPVSAHVAGPGSGRAATPRERHPRENRRTRTSRGYSRPDAEDTRGERRHLSGRCEAVMGGWAPARAAGTRDRCVDRGSQPHVQHRACRGDRARLHARCRRGDCAIGAPARRIARRPSADGFSSARRPPVSGALADLPHVGPIGPRRVSASAHHPLAARGTRVRGGCAPWRNG